MEIDRVVETHRCFCGQLGLLLYLIVMTMVFLRWTFQPLDPTEADPPAWIAAGAVAITVLAGSNLLLASSNSARVQTLAPFIEGVVCWPGPPRRSGSR